MLLVFFKKNIMFLQDYWDFTFSEMGKYDLRANLNFVYQQTGQKVHYIGHSQVQITTTILNIYFDNFDS